MEKGKIIDVRRAPIEKLDLSKPVVICDGAKEYHCGILTNAFNMFALEDGRGNIERTFMPGEIIETGQVIGIYDEEADDSAGFNSK